MKTEFEAKFLDINKDEFRKKLKKLGAKLARPEFMQKRFAFHLPSGHEIACGWLRVRDEQDKITLSLKVVADEKNIEDQKEICLTVDSFDEAVLLLETIGCTKKSYQETLREIWVLDEVEIMIDTWPYIDPFVEVEGKSEEEVIKTSEKLGFDYSKALFCAVDRIAEMQYGMPAEKVNLLPKITFDGPNPFQQ